MNEFLQAEKQQTQLSKPKKILEAKKSVNNYINQLKIHYDLNENELLGILDSVFKTRRNNKNFKKWWQIWK